MSRRGRAAAFVAASILCASVAAWLARSYGDRVDGQLGDLVPVVVAGQDLPAGKPIGVRGLERHLRVRRVPVRFAPPDALSTPDEAIGRAPATRVPAGSYLLAHQLRLPRERRRRPTPGDGRRAVEIAVSGGRALPDTIDEGRVDVVVTSEPVDSGQGRTRVVAAAIRLMDLQPLRDAEVDAGSGDPGSAATLPTAWVATLALTRRQAIELIRAESFARQIRLLPAV